MQEGKLEEFKNKMDEKYGYGNWKIRRVSVNRAKTPLPSLTITEELKGIDLKPGDYVIIALDTKNKCIIIHKA